MSNRPFRVVVSGRNTYDVNYVLGYSSMGIVYERIAEGIENRREAEHMANVLNTIIERERKAMKDE